MLIPVALLLWFCVIVVYCIYKALPFLILDQAKAMLRSIWMDKKEEENKEKILDSSAATSRLSSPTVVMHRASSMNQISPRGPGDILRITGIDNPDAFVSPDGITWQRLVSPIDDPSLRVSVPLSNLEAVNTSTSGSVLPATFINSWAEYRNVYGNTSLANEYDHAASAAVAELVNIHEFREQGSPPSKKEKKKVSEKKDNTPKEEYTRGLVVFKNAGA